MLTPSSLLTIKRLGECSWEVWRTFTRIDGSSVTIRGHGWSRASALESFEMELWQERNFPPQDLFQDWYDSLWQMAGWVDWIFGLIKALANKYTV